MPRRNKAAQPGDTVERQPTGRSKEISPPHEAVTVAGPPASDTEVPRTPVSAGATWQAGDGRDPQLDPVDPINPVNQANPAGPVSEPAVSSEEETSGIPMGALFAIIIVIVVVAVFWFFVVDFNLMGGPASPN
jgi:hypothetical protein